MRSAETGAVLVAQQLIKDLPAGISVRAQVVEQFDTEVDQADAVLGRNTHRYEATLEAWDASHGAVISRGVAATHELQRREDELLDGYLRDPPKRLLEAIGAPPPDPAGRQAWQ